MRVLRNFLTITEATDIKFENFTAEKLADTLSSFYFDARTTYGDTFMISSLENFRHGLNQFLQGPPNNRNINVIKNSEFNGANVAYRYALKELKLNSGRLISEADLKKLYDNMNTVTPYQLQAKVQFDVRFYLFRQGSEKMHLMTKDTFVVKRDPSTGAKYVTKRVDESNQNTSDSDSEQYSALMPECPGDPKCPVASFEEMVSLLHPECDSLWQKPKDLVWDEDPIWFCNESASEDTLDDFMKRQSSIHRLSWMYTNHSVHATGAAILRRLQGGNKSVMSLVGHGSVSVLATYLKDLEEDVKLQVDLNAAVGTATRDAVPAPVSQPTSSTVPAAVCPVPASSKPVIYCHKPLVYRLPSKAPVGTQPVRIAPRTVVPGHKPLVYRLPSQAPVGTQPVRVAPGTVVPGHKPLVYSIPSRFPVGTQPALIAPKTVVPGHKPVVYSLPSQASVGTEPVRIAPGTVVPGHKPVVFAVNTVPGTFQLSAPVAQKVMLLPAANQSIPIVSEKKSCTQKNEKPSGLQPQNVSYNCLRSFL